MAACFVLGEMALCLACRAQVPVQGDDEGACLGIQQPLLFHELAKRAPVSFTTDDA